MLFHESPLDRPFFMNDFSASREDIIKYYQEKFTPGNMVLVISGRFNGRRALLKAAALWKKNHTEGVSPEVENPLGDLADPPEQIRPGRDGNDNVYIGFRAPAFLQEYYFEARLLQELLKPGWSSVWISSDSDAERIDRDISCVYHAESNCGYLIVSVKTGPGNGRQKKEEILRRLNQLKTTGIPGESFCIAKRKLLLDERISFQYTLCDAVLLGTMILSRSSSLSLHEFENRITGITLESAQRAAKNLFKDPVVWISQSSPTQ
jgi:predicted Zn-dependent peptidase